MLLSTGRAECLHEYESSRSSVLRRRPAFLPARRQHRLSVWLSPRAIRRVRADLFAGRAREQTGEAAAPRVEGGARVRLYPYMAQPRRDAALGRHLDAYRAGMAVRRADAVAERPQGGCRGEPLAARAKRVA